MTMTIPVNRQLTFEAKDSTEFRALLGRILDTSPLSCGQIAVKTGMPRSTAYSLPDTKRPGLPSNPAQVVDFVRACGLPPTQVELVMDLWQKLQQEAENTRTSEGRKNGGPLSTSSMLIGEDLQVALSHLTLKELLQHGYITDEDLDHAKLRDLIQTGFGGKRPRRLATSWTDLLQYILAYEERTRRAVMLLIPITLLLLSVVCALVFLAVQMPTITPVVVAGLLAPVVLLARRRSVRVRKPKARVSE